MLTFQFVIFVTEIQIETKLKFFICSYSFNGSDGYYLSSLNDIYEDVIIRDEEPCRYFDEKYRYLCEPTPFLVSACLVKDLTRKNDKKDQSNKTAAAADQSRNDLTFIDRLHSGSLTDPSCIQRNQYFQNQNNSTSIRTCCKMIHLTSPPNILKNLLDGQKDAEKSLNVSTHRAFKRETAERERPPRKKPNVTVYDHISSFRNNDKKISLI